MHALELKVPPVVVVLLMAALMWLVSWAEPVFAFAFPARYFFALSFTLVGLVVGLLGTASFRRAGTTVNPTKPEASSSLVNSGVYGLTRNPMYLGLLLLLAGWGVFLSNILAFMFLPAFILYINRFQIGPEERALASRFGPVFVSYKLRVRRWL